MSTVVNYTPHCINYFLATGEVYNIESCGTARVSVTNVSEGNIGPYSLVRSSFGKVNGLPDEQTGTFYIVSQMVKSACPSRTDLLVPAEMVRDKEGKIIGCTAFQI
jgi:hypothetical protein